MVRQRRRRQYPPLQRLPLTWPSNSHRRVAWLPFTPRRRSAAPPASLPRSTLTRPSATTTARSLGATARGSTGSSPTPRRAPLACHFRTTFPLSLLPSFGDDVPAPRVAVVASRAFTVPVGCSFMPMSSVCVDSAAAGRGRLRPATSSPITCRLRRRLVRSEPPRPACARLG